MFQRVDSQVLNVPSQVTKEVVFGPKRTQALKVPFDSSTNSSANLNYQFAPKAIVTNDWYLEYYMTVQVTAPAGALVAGSPIFAGWGTSIAPREFQLLWECLSVTLRLNDQVFSCQLRDLMPYMSKCLSNEDAMRYADVGTALPDQGFFNYGDAVGTSKNVLASYNDSRENWTPRGSWQYLRVGTALTNGLTPNGTVPVAGQNGGGSGYIQFKMTTPFMIPPLHNLALNTPVISLANLYNINININFDSSFSRILSVPAGWTANSGDVGNVFGSTNGGNLNLYMISSYASDMQSIPSEVRLPNVIFDIKTQSLGSDLSPLSVLPSVGSNIFQYDSYPDAFVVYVHKRSSKAIASDSNSFFPLSDKFSITINGDSNLLNGYTKSQMYQLCKKYVRMDFQEFLGKTNAVINGIAGQYPTSGPVYVFRPAIDLPISENAIAPNMSGYRIQMQFNNLEVENWTNETFTDANVELVVISVRSGEVILTPSSGSQTANTLSQADVVSALTKDALYTDELQELEGGKMRMTTAMSGRGKSGGGKSGGVIPLGTAVPKSHTSRF